MIDTQEAAQNALAEYLRVLETRMTHPERYADTRALTFDEGLLIIQQIHPTKRKASVDLTVALIDYIIEKQVCTFEEMQRDLGASHPPLLSRLKTLRKWVLIRRESKKFYMPTPRLQEFRDEYLRRFARGIA